ncbi:Endoplasmic reticulum transmembrane protein 3 [Coemansia javaensis]|uniref:Endoplasmic reticulum transmembrane protein n=1 Tax=Coemansia javaensis TaxID=2761396 RepID=A0A9W8HAZ6_9FUNG|nr:Endoplasmic reticulum transmembrane protein 3 [Coemansia javaensis]
MATLQYTGVFTLLVAEVLVFIALILPMPLRWKRAMVVWTSRSVVVQRILYGVRIAFGFIFVLFADAVMRLRKAELEKDRSPIIDEHTLCQRKLQKFYAQRNTYLTGITMFLGLILISTHSLVAQLAETSTTAVAASDLAKARANADQARAQLADARKEIAELQRKDRDMDTLKKQAEASHREYMRLADECEKLQKQVAASESKKDA